MLKPGNQTEDRTSVSLKSAFSFTFLLVKYTRYNLQMRELGSLSRSHWENNRAECFSMFLFTYQRGEVGDLGHMVLLDS